MLLDLILPGTQLLPTATCLQETQCGDPSEIVSLLVLRIEESEFVLQLAVLYPGGLDGIEDQRRALKMIENKK